MPYVFAASSAGVLPQIALTNSQTWVPPMDGNICIHVIGAGGAGEGHGVQSGGAGGYCKKNSLAVTTSGSYTVVIGTGGAGGQNGNGGNGHDIKSTQMHNIIMEDDQEHQDEQHLDPNPKLKEQRLTVADCEREFASCILQIFEAAMACPVR